MRNNLKGLLAMAAIAAAMGSMPNSERVKRRRELWPKTKLTQKQEKVRAREKKAKLARKLNR